MCWSGTGAGYAGDDAWVGGFGLCGLIEPPVVLPVPGQEFIEPALRRSGDAGEHVGKPGPGGIDIVELGGADEVVHGRRAHAAAVGTGEQP